MLIMENVWNIEMLQDADKSVLVKFQYKTKSLIKLEDQILKLPQRRRKPLQG